MLCGVVKIKQFVELAEFEAQIFHETWNSVPNPFCTISHKKNLVGRIPKKWAKCILFDDKLKCLNKLFLKCSEFAEKPYRKEFSHVQRSEYKKKRLTVLAVQCNYFSRKL